MKEKFGNHTTENSFKCLETGLQWNRERKHILKERIMADISLLEQTGDAAEENVDQIAKRGRTGSVGKKLVYISLAAIFLGALTISSSFVSPAMAEVVSKIPILKLMINQPSPVQIVAEELDQHGFEYNAVGSQGKWIEVSLAGDQEYVDKVSENVARLAESALESNNFNAYQVKITRMNENQFEAGPEEDKKWDELKASLEKELKSKDFNILSLYIRDANADGVLIRDIQVEIPHTETRVKELKLTINSVVEANKAEKFPILVKKINQPKKLQEDRWATGVVAPLYDQLMGKKEFRVTGVSYTVYPEPEITLNTSVESSDSGAEQFADELQALVDNFLKSGEMAKAVQGDPYSIIIYSKDKKRLN
ncbi:DUF4030 domain-containing protein [Mesobacillus foraminis]|uniref:DUF4030 domain-containing protein n=1 Tax=Mesobacillus foraminis TaxID=279826 RepID=UPI001BE4E64D|nr:DUF4030 domain-containing protein [Mesobacillus foraminis]MBT2756905.1 DUF4030 domain-containing protein [Mesobacillus foraminis]